jgi:hypothetical protein
MASKLSFRRFSRISEALTFETILQELDYPKYEIFVLFL